jgi:hypothetical protein
MENEESLPKPQKDLPLLEKEILSHSEALGENDGDRYKNNLKPKFIFLGFVVISVLIAFLIGGFVLGSNKTSKQTPQVVSANPIPNLKSDWKTYKGNVFSLKYPKDYQLNINKIIATAGIVEPQENTIQLISPALPGTNGNLSIIITHKATKLYLEQAAKEGSSCSELSDKKLDPVKIGDLTFSQSGLINCGPNEIAFFYILNKNNIYEVKVETTADYQKDALPIVRQILSTIKFNKVVPTATPTTNPIHTGCTLEAKLCPDGSYVGRTGPNCEFTPCATQ